MLLGANIMAKGKVFIELTESNATIKEKIFTALAEEVNTLFNKNKKTVKRAFSMAIKSWIDSCPEMISLRNSSIGSLAAQFGLPQGTADNAVSAISNAIASSISVDLKPFNKKLKGSVYFYFQRSDFTNLLSLPEGHVVTERNTDLHWLDWLLTQGDTTIITGFNYQPNSLGRSGGGIMTIGGMWRVPPEFAGTQENNFITRAFIENQTQIKDVLKGLLK